MRLLISIWIITLIVQSLIFDYAHVSFFKVKSILPAPKDQGQKIQMVLDFLYEDVIWNFFDTSDYFVWVCFVYAPFELLLIYT